MSDRTVPNMHDLGFSLVETAKARGGQSIKPKLQLVLGAFPIEVEITINLGWFG